MDLEIRKFQTAIQNFINESDLPKEVKKLVLQNILNDVIKDANLAVSEQLEAEEEKADAENIQQN